MPGGLRANGYAGGWGMWRSRGRRSWALACAYRAVSAGEAVSLCVAQTARREKIPMNGFLDVQDQRLHVVDGAPLPADDAPPTASHPWYATYTEMLAPLVPAATVALLNKRSRLRTRRLDQQ